MVGEFRRLWPLLDDVNMEAMRSSAPLTEGEASRSETNSQNFKLVAQAHARHTFVAECELLACIAEAVDREADCLEGCHCHEQYGKAPSSYRQR